MAIQEYFTQFSLVGEQTRVSGVIQMTNWKQKLGLPHMWSNYPAQKKKAQAHSSENYPWNILIIPVELK